MTEQLARVEAALEARVSTRMVPGLPRITALLDLLGSPQRAYPSVHVGGTNGKTSTCRMVDALLRGLGLRTGRYTSPHLTSITERIALDGEPIDGDRFAAVYDEIAPFIEMVDARHDAPMTYFEITTAMAFAAFADAPVDVAVVEVGLGGRWDATNVLAAPVAVITPVDLDHTQVLGDTVEQIAGEKAGIIHPGVTAVIGRQPLAAAETLLRRAVEVGATVAREGVEFGVLSRTVGVGGQQLTLQGLAGRYDDILLPLHGGHQAGNAACALAAVEAFLGGRDQLDVDVVREAFLAVTSPGRLEVARTGPTVLLDVAHNPAGARALAEALGEAFAFRRLVGLVAVLADKDAVAMLEALEPMLDEVVVTANSSARALAAADLGAVAEEVFGGHRVTVVPALDEALAVAIERAEAPSGGDLGGGGVLVTGSVVTVGDAKVLLGG